MTLEEKFKEALEASGDRIREKIAEACRALEAAVAISEEYGVPFYSPISFLSQNYTPESLAEKFPDVDPWDYDIAVNEYPGWEHSAVC
jgi:hypothetical protein